MEHGYLFLKRYPWKKVSIKVVLTRLAVYSIGINSLQEGVKFFRVCASVMNKRRNFFLTFFAATIGKTSLCFRIKINVWELVWKLLLQELDDEPFPSGTIAIDAMGLEFVKILFCIGKRDGDSMISVKAVEDAREKRIVSHVLGCGGGRAAFASVG